VFPETVAGVFGSPQVSRLLVPFAIYLICYPIAMVSVSGLRGSEMSTETTIIRDVVAPAVAIGVFLLMAELGRPLLGAIAYYVSIQILISVPALYLLFRQIERPLEGMATAPGQMRDLLSFSWPLAISANLILVMNNFDILMIGFFLGSEQAGLYKVVQPLGKLVMLPLQSFTFLYLPIVTRYFEAGDTDFLREAFTATTKWISLLTFPIVLLLSLYSRSIIQVFYRPQYLPAAAALVVYAMGTFFRAFVGPNGAMIKAIDQTRVDLVSSVAGVLTNIVLNVVLIPRFGISGAALATGVGYLVYNLTEVGVVYYMIGVHPFSFATVKPLVVTGLVALAVRNSLVPDRVGLVVLPFLGVGLLTVELISVVATRALDRRDRLLLVHVLEQFDLDPNRLPAVLNVAENEK